MTPHTDGAMLKKLVFYRQLMPLKMHIEGLMEINESKGLAPQYHQQWFTPAWTTQEAQAAQYTDEENCIY